MPLQLMSDDRHQHLIKCAEQVIGLMNIGIEPDAALLKVAKDSELNSNEVMRVSHAVNNSKTLSVLVNEETENKDKPFLITNAELVNSRLYDADPASDAEAKKDEKDAEKNEKTDAMEPKLAALGQPKTNFPLAPKKKRKAAITSNKDKGSYLAGEPVDHAADFKAMTGTDTVKHDTTKVAVSVGDNHQVNLSITGSGRVVGNPFHKLSALKHRIDEASIAYTIARDDANGCLCGLADAFARTDAPAFDRIEKMATAAGVGEETIALLFEAGNLAKYGHKRAAGEKLAGLIDCTAREQAILDTVIHVEKSWKLAGQCLAERDLLRDGYNKVDGELKTAAAIGIGNISAGVGALSEDLANLPDRMAGKGIDDSYPVDLFGGAAGSTAEPGSAPEPLTEESALPANIRQQMSNANARGNIEELMADPFIKEHPIQDVVEAYNKVKGVNPDLSPAELSTLIRSALASDGTLPFDTLTRARGKAD